MNKLKEISGKYYQECSVVMLSTDKATWPNCIWLGRISNQLRLDTSYNNKPKSIPPIDDSMLPQHLYFLSNEKIKEGDWYLNIVSNEIVNVDFNIDYEQNHCKKIIATTDTSLLKDYSEQTLNGVACLPQPSKSFIQAYIKAYNEGNPITKVLVEVEKSICDNCKGEGYLPDNIPMYGAKRVCESCMGKGLSSTFKLKINSSNEITIKKIKDSYTREEHCTDMQYYMEYCERNGYVTPMEWLDKLKHY